MDTKTSCMSRGEVICCMKTYRSSHSSASRIHSRECVYRTRGNVCEAHDVKRVRITENIHSSVFMAVAASRTARAVCLLFAARIPRRSARSCSRCSRKVRRSTIGVNDSINPRLTRKCSRRWWLKFCSFATTFAMRHTNSCMPRTRLKTRGRCAIPKFAT